MVTQTEGIVFRQVKTASGRRMILLFTKKYGKISVGSFAPDRGRTRSALAMEPFVHGSYEIFVNRDSYNMNGGEVRDSFYRMGEDLDKYMCASFVLELTDKLIPEEVPQPGLFDLLLDFLRAMEKRRKDYETLVLAYEIKALGILGTFPEIDRCVSCGGREGLNFFSVPDGGMLCKACSEKKQINIRDRERDGLIFRPEFDIVNILKYFSAAPISTFEKIALEAGAAKGLQRILRAYMSYHMDIGTLKSESFFSKNF